MIKFTTEDVRLLIVNSGYMSDVEDCGYDEYLFAVRKKWLYDYWKTVADHPMTDADIDWFFENESTSDDTYLVYQAALLSKEIVFEKPCWYKGIKYYEVGETVVVDGVLAEQVFCRTLDYAKARKVFDSEYEKVKAEIDRNEFFFGSFDEADTLYEGECQKDISFGPNNDGDTYTLYLKDFYIEEEGKNA